MQGKEQKDFFQGGGDFDSADFRVRPNDWVNMENCRIGSTDKGVIGTVEGIGSTILKSTIEPSITNRVIGVAEDVANRMFCYFVKDLYGPWDKILAYDLDTETIYTVLLSSQVTGGLNFDKYHLIHSARIINRLLYWTDNLNQPRRVNLESAINMNHPGTFPGVNPYFAPITAESITLIRKPPVFTLDLEKFNDPDIEANQIKNNAFRFAYFYTYKEGEISTISPHSEIANYNYPGDDYNSIHVSIPFAESPDQDVLVVSIVVIYVDTNTGFVIKTWDKSNAAQATEIANHVNFITQLSFDFSNDAVGEAISAAALAKPFDSVPLLSQTLEQGTNRLFLGGNLIGYNTPTVTSLEAEIVSQGSAVRGNWYAIRIDYKELNVELGCIDAGLTQTYYFPYFPIAVDGTHPAGFYDLTSDPLFYRGEVPPSLPSVITIANFTWIGTNPSGDVFSHITTYDGLYIPFIICGRTFLDVTPGDPVETAGGGLNTNVSVLKSDSPYRLGIVFYDRYLRQCGVVAGPKITTPDRNYDDPLLNYGIQWTLDTGPQPDEIPDWAYYYSIVSTKSLRTSFFVQARAGDIVYVTKDSSGNYVFTSTTYADTNFGIGLKLDLLAGIGMGYSYQAGDIVKVYIDGSSTIYTLAVLDQSGEWVIGELADLGSLASTNAFFEIYTPSAQAAAELYYELGAIYDIMEPTTSARRYTITSNFLPGDVYLLTRGSSPNDYVTENMSPNTTLWRNWFTNAGRPQSVVKQGQRFKQTSVKWSNTFIPGTVTNGLSSFDALDEKILPGELGPLRKLIITSKVNNELGSVMLGICEQETVSMYLGEQQLVGSSGNAFIAQASDVIGTLNVLKGSYGTINPESVCEFKGNVYWVDVYNGKVIQYSASGLFPISQYKMTRFWKLFCDAYLKTSRETIESYGMSPFIYTSVDSHHWELLITIPQLLSRPPKSVPDYGFAYPFDIWDGTGKTLVFKLNQEPNFWQGCYRVIPEYWMSIQNQLFSFKYGRLYEHNSTISFNVLYGLVAKPRIMFVCNQIPTHPKVYNNISIQGSTVPTFTYFMTEVPYMQTSDLADFDFRNLEGVMYSIIYRNKIIPTATGFVITGLLTGEKMRGTVLKVYLEFPVTEQQFELKYVDVGYQDSVGHTII